MNEELSLVREAIFGNDAVAREALADKFLEVDDPQTATAVREMSMGFFVRPECGFDDRWGPTLGPFPDWLQVTYRELRIEPDGDTIAWLGDDGLWYFADTYRVSNTVSESIPADFTDSFGLNGRCWYELGWSDFVIWSKLSRVADVPKPGA